MKRLLLGVGNRLSRDDALGPEVARRLAETGTTEWQAIDCGTALENASGLVTREKPDLLVIVDAARMGLPAGSIRRLPTTGSDQMLASTHGLPLPFVLDRLRSAASEVHLIGVEPADTSFGDGLTGVAEDAADRLVQILRTGNLADIPAVTRD